MDDGDFPAQGIDGGAEFVCCLGIGKPISHHGCFAGSGAIIGE